jgi:hypothetical protein
MVAILGLTISAEPEVAPDCGGVTVSQRSKSHQPPQQVNFGVRRRDERADSDGREGREVLG